MMLMLRRENYFSKFPSVLDVVVCLVLPGPALQIIYTSLAVISLHNGAASNISLTTHHSRKTRGTTHNIFLPYNFPGADKTEKYYLLLGWK